MDRRNRRAKSPAVERVEARDLLSSLIAMRGGMDHVVHARQVAPSPIAAQPAPGQGGTAGEVPNQALRPTGVPTQHERAREAFRATYSGPFTVGRGRFSTEARQVYARGSGTSKAFLHGDQQMRIIIPTDPSAPVTGVIAQYDRSNASGGVLGLSLIGSPGDVDRAGRPTTLAFIVDTDISAGIFTGATGQGAVTIRYIPSGRSGPGIFSQGTAQVLVRGTIFTSGVNGPLRNVDIDP
jgi:hypothetical protein